VPSSLVLLLERLIFRFILRDDLARIYFTTLSAEGQPNDGVREDQHEGGDHKEDDHVGDAGLTQHG